MNRLSALAGILVTGASSAYGQGRPIDWPSFGGDAQRSGWEKSDSRITKENVKDFVLVLKRKLDNRETGQNGITPPVVIGTLISYRGFKELAFVAGSSGKVWAIDADMDRIFWQRNIPSSVAACPGSVTAIPALTPPMNFGAGRPRPAAAPPSARPASPRVGGSAFGNPRSVFVLAGDGQLHQLNSSDGTDQFPALKFIPPSAKASSLTVNDGVIYTTTAAGCGGAPNGVWALNLNDAEPQPASYLAKGGGIGGTGGFALGADGTVFMHSGETLVSLAAKDLALKHEFKSPGSGGVTPVVFTYKGKEMVVSAGKEGSLSLLDAQSLEALFQTPPVAAPKHGVWGGLSSWEDSEGTRWVLAPVWGGLSSEMKALALNGAVSNGAVVAFRLEEHDGKPVLTPSWISRDLSSPLPPVITSGVVFTVATGPAHATLYALDGLTGKELYSTGNQVTARGNLMGMSVVNGRVYFTTADNTLYAFGIYMER